ncbi:MAG: acetate--CoA ligase family protein [bacterium]
MKDILQPKSVAIIGASSHPEKIGFSVLKNIIDGGFQGRIIPINPASDNILGLNCLPSVSEIRGVCDLAVIVVPAKIVPEVLTECGKKRIRTAIIISAGFAEAGSDGKALQDELVKIAKLYSIRILGPNCLGIIDPVHKLNASFATNMPAKRNIAVISQSGATCTAILDWANGNNIGFSHFISLGNKADINENDFLEYMIDDKDTKVVVGYLESISEPERFLDIAKRLTKKKPFILLKAGRSTRGSVAAASHTAALAADDEVIETVFAETGIIRAETLEDLFELSTIFSDMKLPTGNKVLVLTNAGGPGVMTTDAIANSKNLEFYEIAQKEQDILSKILPLGASVKNPIDLLGDANSKTFENTLKILKGKTDADLKLILITPQTSTDAEEIARVIVKNTAKDVVVALIGGTKLEEARKILSENRICTFLYPERAVFCLDKLIFYAKYIHKKSRLETYTKVNKGLANRVIKAYKLLDDADIAKIFMAYGIPMANSKLTTSAKDAIKAAEKIGYPIVLKVTSPDILHKTEVGAIKIGIDNPEDLKSSYQEVLKNARKHHPKANILGVTVYHMVRSTVEVAIGAKRDPLFGPVIMFGLGGTYIELFRDFKLGLAPVSVGRAKDMIRGIRYFEMLNGYRNGEKFDIEALAIAISGLSQLMLDFHSIKEIDVNPIRVNTDHKGILALDAKIIFDGER